MIPTPTRDAVKQLQKNQENTEPQKTHSPGEDPGFWSGGGPVEGPEPTICSKLLENCMLLKKSKTHVLNLQSTLGLHSLMRPPLLPLSSVVMNQCHVWPRTYRRHTLSVSLYSKWPSLSDEDEIYISFREHDESNSRKQQTSSRFWLLTTPSPTIHSQKKLGVLSPRGAQFKPCWSVRVQVGLPLFKCA